MKEVLFVKIENQQNIIFCYTLKLQEQNIFMTCMCL